MIYLSLIFEFLKIGLFSFGGGYATIPFLYQISQTHHWYSIEELTHMVAIASITPGPVGINVATYAGLNTAGILGSALATTSEMFPSLVLVILASKILKKFSNNVYVRAILETLKPISCALLLSVAVGLVKPCMHDIKAITLLVFLIIISGKSKRDPVFYMAIAGFTGVILWVVGL